MEGLAGIIITVILDRYLIFARISCMYSNPGTAVAKGANSLATLCNKLLELSVNEEG